MSYDDYDEGEADLAEPVAVAPPVVLPLPEKVDVSFSVYTAQMQDQILRQVAAQVSKLFEAKVAESVETAVSELVETISREQIAEAIRGVLVAGWPTTDEYGGAKGHASLKDRIGKMLNHHDRYSGRGTWADNIVKEETEKALRGDLQKEIDAAKAKLRAEIDNVTRAKLNDALRKALGVDA